MNIRSYYFFILSLLLPLCESNAQVTIDHWETAVFASDTWSYRPGTSEPPSNWMQPNFDDSTWSTGIGGFGYGDEDDNTIISPTLSLYIRIDFDLIDTSKIDLAVLHADYDDAFVAYLNGSEFARGNFGEAGTPPSFITIPPTDHEAALYDGGVPEAFPIYPSSLDNYLREGSNTLAIQIHNFLITSSDLSSNFFFSLGINDASNDYEAPPDWFYEPFLATDLPLIRINTNGQGIADEPKIVADMEVIDHGPGNLNFFDDPATGYNGKIAIEIRGASSQGFPKNNFGFETQDENGENNNYPLLGMPEENDWILHGPFSDKSLIRNALTFDIGRQMMDYASRTRFCELLVDDDYRGVYLLMERIKRDAERVDIAKLRPEDIEGDELTGGYIFQLDRDDPNTEADGWYSPYGSNPFYAYHHPKYDDLLAVQKQYLRDWMSNFEAAMTSTNYAALYPNFIDEASFVDYFLINELTKHVDAFKLSFYMYKRKDSNGGKLHMGPIWDFNLGYGNFDFECAPEPEGWIYPCTSSAFWLDKLLEVPAIQNQIYCRWEELRTSILNTQVLHNRIDQMAAELSNAQKQNFSRWNILGQYVWPNFYVGNTYSQEVNFLKSWLAQRLNWMDQNIQGMPNTCFTNTENDLDPVAQVAIFPNPFEDQLTFNFKNAQTAVAQLSIIDAVGKTVYHNGISLEEDFSLNTTAFAKGIYFYQVSVENKATVVGKIVKQ